MEQYFRKCIDEELEFDLQNLLVEYIGPNYGKNLNQVCLSDLLTIEAEDHDYSILSRGSKVAVISAWKCLCVLLRSAKEPLIPFLAQDPSVFTKDGLVSLVSPNKYIFGYIISYVKQFRDNYQGTPSLDNKSLGGL
jgi:hypothetical protein